MAGPDDTPTIRLIIDNAEEVAPPPDLEPDDEAPRRGGGGPVRPPALPMGCPVRPLGIDGETHYYLDAHGQLAALEAKDHGRLRILALFGPESSLCYEFWPRRSPKGDITGWRPEDAALALMGACSAEGLWSPALRMRGRGGWRDPQGELLVHAGDRVFAAGGSTPPGLVKREVLAARQPILRPAPVTAGREAGEEVLQLFGCWRWRREIDARLLLGHVGAGFYGAALRWRPVAWIVGGRSTGKSTLQEKLAEIYGGWLLSVVEPTPAAVWQTLRYDALPIAIDEAEAEEDPRRLAALIKLARLCASGGRLIRGGADHEAAEFILRSTVTFSSIRRPALLAQDASRIILLRLDELGPGRAPSIAPARLEALGAQLLRRMIDGWGRFPQALEAYRAALEAVGHKGRGVDVFGTALACADLLLHDHDVDADSAQELAAQLDHASLPEAEDDLSDQQRWLQRLLSCVIPLEGVGGRNTVAEWLRQAKDLSQMHAVTDDADRVLGMYGIKIMRPKNGGRPTQFAIANSHAGLDKLHQGTHWAGRSGAQGVWVQAARDLPGATVTTQRFAGPPDKGTALPLELVFPAGDDGQRAHPAPAPSFALDD